MSLPGCLRTGAVYLPLNVGNTLAKLENFIGDAEPSATRSVSAAVGN